METWWAGCDIVQLDKSSETHHLQGWSVGLEKATFFDTENEGSTFYRNVRELPLDYTASHVRRWYSAVAFYANLK
jgi:hypothetical protein